MEDIEAEVKALAHMGYKEVVLTGIHISSYGIDLENVDLLSLLETLNKIEGLERIRLGSLEPRIITEEFVSRICTMKKICPHFHLSMQSGCDATLKRMNRHYTCGEYYEKCEILRKHYDRVAITTDVIVGFPQESEEEFQESRSFVEKVKFYETHIFKYSKREGTNAAKMQGQIPEPEKTRRSGILIELGRKHKKEFLEYYLGKEIEILIEEEISLEGKTVQVGHTREYMKAVVETEEKLHNQIVRAKVTGIYQGEMLLTVLK